MGRQTVVGVKQFHSSGTAVGETAEGLVPGGVCGACAEEFITQRRLQQFIGNRALIVAEIGKFIVFCLQQQNVVERDLSRIVDGIPEQFAALQHDGLRGNIRPGKVGSYTPAGPGAHGVSADGHSLIVDKRKSGQIPVGQRTASGRILDAVAVAVLGIMIVEEGKIGEVHQHAVAQASLDRGIGPVLLRVVPVVDGNLVVDVSSFDQTGSRRSVSVFIQTHDDSPSSGQFDRIGGAGLMVVLIAVQQQDGRSPVGGGSVLRGVELIGQIIVPVREFPLRDDDIAFVFLYPVRQKHAGRRADQQNKQQN